MASEGIQVIVTTPKGTREYSKQDASKGKFAFTSKSDGDHRICFTNKGERPVLAGAGGCAGRNGCPYLRAYRCPPPAPCAPPSFSRAQVRRSVAWHSISGAECTPTTRRAWPRRSTWSRWSRSCSSLRTWPRMLCARSSTSRSARPSTATPTVRAAHHSATPDGCCPAPAPGSRLPCGFPAPPSPAPAAESTNTRVLWFTVLSIVLLVALTAVQVFVLQRSLAKEKLIDARPLMWR